MATSFRTMPGSRLVRTLRDEKSILNFGLPAPAARTEPAPAQHRAATMTGRRKSDVQFILPEPEPQDEVAVIEEYDLGDTPYTSILMSTASGDGYAKSHAATSNSESAQKWRGARMSHIDPTLTACA